MKKLLLAIALCCVFLAAGPPAMAANVVDIVDISINGLESMDLGAFDLNVNYDNSVLEFQSFYLTDALGSISLGDADDWSFGDDRFGTVNIAVLSWLDPVELMAQPDSFRLASLVFFGEESAIVDISLSDIVLGDALGDPIPFTVDGTTINAIPIPGAVWLLSSALLGIIGLRKRSRK